MSSVQLAEQPDGGFCAAASDAAAGQRQKEGAFVVALPATTLPRTYTTIVLRIGGGRSGVLPSLHVTKLMLMRETHPQRRSALRGALCGVGKAFAAFVPP